MIEHDGAGGAVGERQLRRVGLDPTAGRCGRQPEHLERRGRRRATRVEASGQQLASTCRCRCRPRRTGPAGRVGPSPRSSGVGDDGVALRRDAGVPLGGQPVEERRRRRSGRRASQPPASSPAACRVTMPHRVVAACRRPTARAPASSIRAGSSGRSAQWRKCRSPVNTMATPSSSALAMSSPRPCTEPPGWTMTATPAAAAASMPSGNG